MKKVLVYRIGNLGDTIVAVPSFRVIRRHYPNAHLILLAAKNASSPFSAKEVLQGTHFFDSLMEYTVHSSLIRKYLEMFRLRLRLRREKIEELVYLAPSLRSEGQRNRDRRFFLECGIRKMVGLDPFEGTCIRDASGRVAVLPRESDNLLRRLQKAGMDIVGAYDSLLSEWADACHAPAVLDKLKLGQFPKQMAVLGIGAKTPSQKWPLERYREVGEYLTQKKSMLPVVMGGAEDQADAQALVDHWGSGVNACGRLTIAESIFLMSHCRLYVGNDTGTMHMAALAGMPCVAIFSARNNPGLWEPMGNGHRVLRRQVPCAGCHLAQCSVEGHPCLDQITPSDVLAEIQRVCVS